MDKYYFYTHLESEFNRRRVLAMLEGKLPLTNPSRYNDPFDSRLRFAPGFMEEDAVKYLGWDTDELSNSRKIQRELGLDPGFQALSKKAKEVFSRWTAFSVSEEKDSLLMWAHYGAQHKGICLELEYDADKKPESALFEKIRYTTHYPQDIRVSIDSDLDRASLETLLLTKSIEWHYEREWRFAIQDAPAEVDFPGEQKFDGVIDSPFRVTGVCYGFKCEDGDHSDYEKQPNPDMWRYTKIAVIGEIDERTDIAVYQNTLSGTEFKLLPMRLGE